jgi:hypothetical protein
MKISRSGSELWFLEVCFRFLYLVGLNIRFDFLGLKFWIRVYWVWTLIVAVRGSEKNDPNLGILCKSVTPFLFYLFQIYFEV